MTPVYNVTEWFRMPTKPMHIGVYQVQEEFDGNDSLEGEGLIWYSYWDGLKFNWWDTTPDDAELNRERSTSAVAHIWRGVKKDAAA